MFSRNHNTKPEILGASVRKSTGALTGVLHSRRVPLRGPITERTAACAINRMLVLAADNKQQPIVIEIDSTGGPIADALSVIRTMNGIPCPVGVFCRGHVQGSAIVIAAHGVKSYRVSMESAQFGFGSLHASANEAGRHAMLQLLAQDTGRQEADIVNWLSHGGGFDPQEAIRRGIIDVLDSKPAFPMVNEGLPA